MLSLVRCQEVKVASGTGGEMLHLLCAMCLLPSLVVVSESAQVEVTTKLGLVRGVQRVENGKPVNVFLGIPYAQPPIGPLRFRSPRPLTNWSSSVINATTLPNTCPQNVSTDPFEGIRTWAPNTNLSEDCLYLNVWAPAGPSASSRAVMVWIHGGGLYSGSSTLALYDGTVLAAVGDVIMVSMQYRLGGLGFLYLGTSDAPGNVGLLDQRLALQWVADNIAAFGGDPKRVTIFGESAGAASVGLHLLSRGSESLFQYAIMQSGSSLGTWPVDTAAVALDKAYALSKLVKCGGRETPVSSIAKCLRNVDAIKLSNLTWSVPDLSPIHTPFMATVDGNFLSDLPSKLLSRGLMKNTSILTGSNLHEGYFFLLQKFPQFSPADRVLNKTEFDMAAQNILRERSDAVQETAKFEYLRTLSSSSQPPAPRYRELLQDILGDYLFVCPVVHTAEAFSKYSSAYLYQFSHRTSANPWPTWMGVLHGYELDHVFGAPLASSGKHKYDSQEKDLSSKMIAYWTKFAKTGNPNTDERGNDEGTWPAYTSKDEQYLVLDTGTPMQIRRQLREYTCDFWQWAPQLDDICSGGHVYLSVTQLVLFLLAINYVINRMLVN